MEELLCVTARRFRHTFVTLPLHFCVHGESGCQCEGKFGTFASCWLEKRMEAIVSRSNVAHCTELSKIDATLWKIEDHRVVSSSACAENRMRERQRLKFGRSRRPAMWPRGWRFLVHMSMPTF